MAVSGVDDSTEHTATAGQTTFTATYTVGSLNVFLNGVKLDSTDYTATNGSNVVLDTGAALNDSVFIQSFGTFELADMYTKTAADARFLGLAGGTMTGDVSLGDNVKAKFGAGDDLQIYHSGTGSYIEEVGTGNLFIEATNLRIKTASGENYMAADQDGAVTLYNNNSAKLATTSSGIDVTGSVTCDGFTSTGIDDNATSTAITIDASENVGIGTASPAGILHLDEGAADDCRLIAETHAGGDSMILFTQGASGAGTPTWGIGLDATNDVLSIGFEDTGYNDFSLTGDSKFVIDNSGNVGIGTASPNARLDLEDTVTNSPTMRLTCPSSGNPAIEFRATSNWQIKSKAYTGTYALDINYARNIYNGGLTISDNGAERVRFPSSGGITFNGDTAAANALDDYEEGTWTPGFSFGGGSVGMTYSVQSGYYTKVGDLVTVSCYCVLTNKGTSTGNAAVTGLPFTTSGASSAYSAASFWPRVITFADFFMGYSNVNNTIVHLHEVTNGGGESALSNANFANGSNTMMTLSYRV
jgi:hypothetical protein